MKKFFQYILVTALMGGAVTLASCDDDEDTLNEWNMTYVSIQPEDYLRPVPTFNLKHVLNEKIEGEVSLSVVASIQKVSSHDIKMNIDAACEGIAPERINKSAEFAVIKAGQTKSEPVTVSISDWSDIEGVKEAKAYSLNIKNAGIETFAPEVTNSNFMQSISVKINKGEAKPENLVFGDEPADSELHTNVTDWAFEFMPGVENPNSNSVAGTGSSDVATNGVPFWVTVDFKAPQTITGIKTRHWGGAFAPTKIELLTSDDGKNWTSQGEVVTKGGYQVVAFKKPVTAQHLKYRMINVPWRVDIMQLHVYMKK